MAEQPELKVTVYNLTRNVPEGLQLSGLSVPKFDGENYYRQPTAQSSTIGFSTTGPRFVQFEYQLYSPGSAVAGRAALNGKPLGEKTFAAGKFVDNALLGGFVPSGEHQTSLTYTCSPACAQPPSQYWTKLTVIEDARVKAREDTGLGTERLWLNAPGTDLKVSGTGSVTFDGFNYRRPIEGQSFTLGWPESARPLNVGFTVNSGEPFRVTTRAGDKVLSIKKGDAKTGVSSVLSLVGQPEARSVTVQVDCLKTQQCASLYFPNVNVLTPSAWAMPSGAIILAALLLVALMGLLGVGPRLRRG